jgi:hypothetical protein
LAQGQRFQQKQSLERAGHQSLDRLHYRLAAVADGSPEVNNGQKAATSQVVDVPGRTLQERGNLRLCHEKRQVLRATSQGYWVHRTVGSQGDGKVQRPTITLAIRLSSVEEVASGIGCFVQVRRRMPPIL